MFADHSRRIESRPLPARLFHRVTFAFALSAAVFAIVAAPVASHAQCANGSTYTFLSLNTALSTGDGCSITLDPVGITIVQVVASPHAPISKVTLSVQDPPFGQIISEAWNYPATGTVQTGVELTLPCVSGPNTVLGTLIVFHQGSPVGCERWFVDADPVVEDCAGTVKPAEAKFEQFFTLSGTCCIFPEPCFFAPPFDLFPPDGATSVPTNVVMSWSDHFPLLNSVIISTDPTCGSGTSYPVSPPSGTTYAPNFLQPSTTYYWQVDSNNGICFTRSAWQSFTTEGTVPTDDSTWGSIKALFE